MLALDVGTEFVKAGILRVEGGHGFVTGYARVRQKPGDMTAGAVSDIAAVTANCEEALKIAAKRAGVLPEQAVLGIAGELVTGKTTQLSFTRQQPIRRIDQEELAAIIQQAQQQAFREVRDELAQRTGYQDLDIKLVHAAIVGTRIDGQFVANPIGFQGEQVEIWVMNAFAPLIHFGALQTISAELDLDTLAIVAEPYAVSRVLMDDSGSRNAIAIDIGGGTTDLAVLRGPELGLRMFAIGGRTFTKRLSQSFQISHAKAEQMKIDYATGQLPDRQAQAVKKALAGDLEVWLAGVELMLGEMAGGRPLPTEWYLCGGGSRLPDILQALQRHDFRRTIPIARQPSIRFLVPDDLDRITDETGTTRTVQDVTPLALGQTGLQLIGSESVADSLLRRALSLISH